MISLFSRNASLRKDAMKLVGNPLHATFTVHTCTFHPFVFPSSCSVAYFSFFSSPDISTLSSHGAGISTRPTFFVLFDIHHHLPVTCNIQVRMLTTLHSGHVLFFFLYNSYSLLWCFRFFIMAFPLFIHHFRNHVFLFAEVGNQS